MPKLWSETVDAHRRAVRDATLDATAALVAERGLASVTMSRIAEEAGIGRATLYRYFPDVEAVLLAWHQRQVARHVERLADVRDRLPGPERLEAVLTAYALLQQEHHGTDPAAALHRGEHVAHAGQRVRDLVAALVAEGADRGELRSDVGPAELATFCVHALAAAGALPSQAAVRRLVAVTLDALRRQEP